MIVDVTRVGKPGGTAHILEEIELSRALFEIYEGAVVCGFQRPFMDRGNFRLFPPLYTVHTPRPNFSCQLISALRHCLSRL